MKEMYSGSQVTKKGKIDGERKISPSNSEFTKLQ
jgi:hypothetical protein